MNGPETDRCLHFSEQSVHFHLCKAASQCSLASDVGGGSGFRFVVSHGFPPAFVVVSAEPD